MPATIILLSDALRFRAEVANSLGRRGPTVWSRGLSEDLHGISELWDRPWRGPSGIAAVLIDATQGPVAALDALDKVRRRDHQVPVILLTRPFVQLTRRSIGASTIVEEPVTAEDLAHLIWLAAQGPDTSSPRARRAG